LFDMTGVTGRCDECHKRVTPVAGPEFSSGRRLKVCDDYHRTTGRESPRFWKGKLRREQLLKTCLIRDDQRRAMNFDKLLALELSEQPRDRLAGCPNHLADFFMCQGQLQKNLAFLFFVVGLAAGR
jgi:hypothetical protein